VNVIGLIAFPAGSLIVASVSLSVNLIVPFPEPDDTVTVREVPDPATPVTAAPVTPVVTRLKSVDATVVTGSEKVTRYASDALLVGLVDVMEPMKGPAVS
jgi:hypothetical protein